MMGLSFCDFFFLFYCKKESFSGTHSVSICVCLHSHSVFPFYRMISPNLYFVDILLLCQPAAGEMSVCFPRP